MLCISYAILCFVIIYFVIISFVIISYVTEPYKRSTGQTPPWLTTERDYRKGLQKGTTERPERFFIDYEQTKDSHKVLPGTTYCLGLHRTTSKRLYGKQKELVDELQNKKLNVIWDFIYIQ